jgi:hypothetical protein
MVCAALAGCAGSEEDGTASETSTVSASQYAERADELCRRLLTDIVDLRVQERLREIQERDGSEDERMERSADVLAEQHALIGEFVREVEALGMPSEHRDDAELLIEKTRSAEAELEQAIDSLRAGDETEATEAMQRYAGFSQQSASIARDSELNFAVCGAGG